MKRWVAAVAIICFIDLFSACFVIFGKDYGSLSVSVHDGRTNAALSGAIAVVAETQKQYKTDSRGETGVMRIPIQRDGRFDGVRKKEWGEATLLIYCRGYYPYALLYTRIDAGKLRSGIRIYLFPDDGSMEEPFVVMESPSNDWAAGLLEQYRPAED